jgi:hypothetical protein
VRCRTKACRRDARLQEPGEVIHPPEPPTTSSRSRRRSRRHHGPNAPLTGRTSDPEPTWEPSVERRLGPSVRPGRRPRSVVSLDLWSV